MPSRRNPYGQVTLRNYLTMDFFLQDGTAYFLSPSILYRFQANFIIKMKLEAVERKVKEKLFLG